MGILVDPDIVRSIGIREAYVFAQIDYWANKAAGGKSHNVVLKNGQVWVAKPLSTWSDELGLSYDQIRRSMNALKLRGMIETKQKLRNGLSILHIRVVQNCTQGPAISHTGSGENAQPYIKTKTVKTEEDSAPVSPDANLSGKKDMVVSKIGLSVSDIQKGKSVSKKVEPIDPAKATKPGELIRVFKHAWLEEWPDTFLPEFTQKQVGQFSQLIKRTPTGKAGLIVDNAVRNWGRFRKDAINDQGAINPPNLPDIGTLLRFIQSATTLYLETTLTEATVTSQPLKAKEGYHSPPKTEKKLTEAPSAEKEKMATFDEILELFGDSAVNSNESDE